MFDVAVTSDVVAIEVPESLAEIGAEVSEYVGLSGSYAGLAGAPLLLLLSVFPFSTLLVMSSAEVPCVDPLDHCNQEALIRFLD